MATAFVGPYSLIIGQSVQVTASEWPSPSQTGYVVIANQSSNTLVVGTSNGNKFLYPYTADVFHPDSNNMNVSPIAQTVIDPGAYIGTITATYYSNDEDPPVGYPLPLPPYPGGQQLLAANANINNSTLPGLPTLVVAPPPGSNLVVQNVQGGVFTTLIPAVVGVQSGTVYTGASNPSNPGLATYWLFNAADNGDYEFKVFYIGHSFFVSTGNVYAIPAQGLPEAPTLQVDLAGNNARQQILPAPPNGMMYALYGADFLWEGGASAAAGDLGIGASGTSPIARFLVPADDVADHVYLNGYQTISAVFYNGPAGSTCTIRYKLLQL